MCGYFCIGFIDFMFLNKKLTDFTSMFSPIVLSTASGRVFVISFATVIGAPAGMESASFALIFSLTTRIIKKLTSATRNKKTKHDKILVLDKNKLYSIETSVSQSLVDLEISHEEFITILKEKEKYEKMKENIRNINEKLEEKTENMRFTNITSMKNLS